MASNHQGVVGFMNLDDLSLDLAVSLLRSGYAVQAFEFDPNGRQCLTMNGYREIGQIVRSLANRHTGGRLLIVQEGGYNVTYSAYCLHAMLEGVLNLSSPLLSDPIAYYPEDEAFSVKVIESIKQYQQDTLPFLKEA